MLAESGKDGHASILDNVAKSFGQQPSCITGNGSFLVDESCQPAKITWIRHQPNGYTFQIQNAENVDDTFEALGAFRAGAVALGGTCNHTFHGIPDENSNRIQAKFDAYTSRIHSLQEDAIEDGYQLNVASEVDFWVFMHSVPNIRRGNMVLLENGNLRVIWRDNLGSQIALQFLGGGIVQYVIFRHRKPEYLPSRAYGRDSFDGIERLINTFELGFLLHI